MCLLSCSLEVLLIRPSDIRPDRSDDGRRLAMLMIKIAAVGTTNLFSITVCPNQGDQHVSLLILWLQPQLPPQLQQ
jgi:hypothetical protein